MSVCSATSGTTCAASSTNRAVVGVGGAAVLAVAAVVGVGGDLAVRRFGADVRGWRSSDGTCVRAGGFVCGRVAGEAAKQQIAGAELVAGDVRGLIVW